MKNLKRRALWIALAIILVAISIVAMLRYRQTLD